MARREANAWRERTGGMAEASETESEFLARYDPSVFPAFALTVDVVLLTIQQERLSVLLVRRTEHPARGAWALPGGFVGEHEDLPDAARHMLARETGVLRLPRGIHLEQLATYGTPDRDPRTRVVSVAYLALIPAIPLPRGRTDEVRFWPVDDLPLTRTVSGDVHLAFDHARIIGDGIERARSKLEYTTVALSLLREPFTLSELRRVYDIVWNVALDPSNFRRAILANPHVVELIGGERTPEGDGRGRPAELYRKGTAYWLDHLMHRPRAPSSPITGAESPAPTENVTERAQKGEMQ